MASSGTTVRVKGLKELNRAINRADKESKKLMKDRFKQVGEIVASDGRSRFSRIDSGSAAGFKTKALTKGVKVEQSRRKVTGKRGDYGALQMRTALVPALQAKRDDVIDELNRALDDVADIIGRG